jgi:AraC family transcriptional activator of mtrCDE
MTAALMNECLVLVFRRLAAQEKEMPWLTALQDPRMARVIQAVLKAPEQPHSGESLAAQAFMGRSAFAHDFKLRFGRTPMRFVLDVRLQKAAGLLRTTDLSVGTAAHRVGFASRSHFSAAFRRHFNLTLAHFRSS